MKGFVMKNPSTVRSLIAHEPIGEPYLFLCAHITCELSLASHSTSAHQDKRSMIDVILSMIDVILSMIDIILSMIDIILSMIDIILSMIDVILSMVDVILRKLLMLCF
jgi:hypothetical protein